MKTNAESKVSTEQLAKEAFQYVQDLNLTSTTTTQANSLPFRQLRDLRQRFFSMRKESRPMSDNPLHDYKDLVRNYELCTKNNLANCEEQAVLAFYYVIQKGAPQINAEVYTIANGDHAFTVIGREPGSDPNDPETWGPDAYICDPLDEIVCPAKEYPSRASAFRSEIESEAKNYTKSITKFTQITSIDKEEFEEYISKFIDAAEGNTEKLKVIEQIEDEGQLIQYYAPTTRARIYVFNKTPGSDDYKPETWGDNAYVCDPRSGKITLASEHFASEPEHFKGVRFRLRQNNYTTEFDPAKHILAPHRKYEDANHYRKEANLEKQDFSSANTDSGISKPSI